MKREEKLYTEWKTFNNWIDMHFIPIFKDFHNTKKKVPIELYLHQNNFMWI